MDTLIAQPPAGGGTPASANTVSNASPTTGQTIAFSNNSIDQTLWLAPAGTLLALTITFPSDASSRLGQTVRLGSSQVITTLTLSGATILNTAATLASDGDMYSFQKVAANTWARLV